MKCSRVLNSFPVCAGLPFNSSRIFSVGAAAKEKIGLKTEIKKWATNELVRESDENGISRQRLKSSGSFTDFNSKSGKKEIS
jgi:hypothetical protein